jgi:hypothetical protein
MIIGLQLAAAAILIAATLKIGELVSGSIEETLGEKPLRERLGDQD